MASQPPYRNNEKARELLTEHLEAENKALAAENERLKAENRRLTIIARELVQSDMPIRRSVTLDVYLQSHQAELERRHLENLKTIQSVNRELEVTKKTIKIVVVGMIAFLMLGQQLIDLIDVWLR